MSTKNTVSETPIEEVKTVSADMQSVSPKEVVENVEIKEEEKPIEVTPTPADKEKSTSEYEQGIFNKTTGTPEGETYASHIANNAVKAPKVGEGVLRPEGYDYPIYVENTYKQAYDKNFSNIAERGYAKAGVPISDFKKRQEYFAQNMGAWNKEAKYITDLQMTSATGVDIDLAMQNLRKDYGDDAEISSQAVLDKLRKADADGNEYYAFGSGKIYSKQLAQDVADHYVNQWMHPIRMKDETYRNEWAMRNYGMPFDALKQKRYDEMMTQYEELENAYETLQANKSWLEKANDFAEKLNLDLMSLPKGLGVEGELLKIKLALNDFDKNGFWSGMGKSSIDALQSVTMDLSGLETTAKAIAAMNKSVDGGNLTPEENFYVAIARLQQTVAQNDEDLNSYDSNASDWGEGVMSSIGFAASLGVQTLATGGAGLFKPVAEASLRKTFIEQGVKKGLSLALQKSLTYGANTAWRTTLTTMPYTNFGDIQKSHFQFTDDGIIREESNPLADLGKGWLIAYNDIFWEGAGGLVDDGLSLLGRKFAQTRLFSKVSNSNLMSKAKDFRPISAARYGVKAMKINSFPGEVAEEYITSFFEPLITGELFSTWREDGFLEALDKHYSEVLSSDYALQTIAICGALSGVGGAIKGVGGAVQGVEVASLRNDIKEKLESIENANLRNTLYEAMNASDSSTKFSSVANIKWGGISSSDAQKATSVIFNSAKLSAMRGELTETERMSAFSPQLAAMVAYSYKGVDMANPSPTLDEIIAYTTESGEQVPVGYVLFGDIDNQDGSVQIADMQGIVRTIPTKDLTFTRQSLSYAIAENYALLFSTSIEKERLNEVVENLRGYNNMSQEAKQKVLADNGFSLYKAGAIVTLADGRQAVVKGNANNGKYIVETTDVNGAKSSLLVGFESILSDNEDMAEAQVEAQAEGVTSPMIPLPTNEKGEVVMDQIDDSSVLAQIMPSMFGSEARAAAALDAEITRLQSGLVSSKGKAPQGLDATKEVQQAFENTMNRIKVLQDARKQLAIPTQETKAEQEVKRNARQAEKDAMSTFDFSRDYRSRMDNTRASRNTLINFINNIAKGLGVIDSAIEETDKQIGKVEAQIGNAYESAMSEADVERIAEETKGLQAKLDTLKAEKAEKETERKKMQHRKAQYKQTLKDMGATEVVEGFQEGEIGGDKEFKALVEKASEALGLPIIVTDESFANSRQNGMHRVSKDGNAIYINSRSTKTEQSVGILAHEIVHEFKQFLTPEEWAKFEDVIMTARFGKDWVNSEAYKKEIESIQDAERKSGHAQGVSNDKAREEAVAYAIQDYIFKGADGVRAFEAIVNQDLNWRDKLMEALRKVVDKLKSLFGKLDAEQNKAVQEAIAEFENVFKRYAQKSGEIKAEQIEGETAAIINEKDGQSSFSLSTYEDGGRDILQNFLTSQVEGGKLNQKDANAILTEMDAIYDICMDYKDEYAPFGAWSDATVVRDDEGMPVFSVIKANGDYAMNLDFSLVCKKRRTLDAVLNEMIGRKLIEIAPDDPTFIAKVNDIVRKYGFETACRLCFVDAKRFRVVSTARNFCKLYNGVVAKLMPTDKKVAINSFDAAGVGYPTHEGSLDTLADSELNIKALEDILKRNGEKTVIAKIARHLLEHPEDRKLVHISDFVSTRGFDPTKALNPQILSLYNSKKGSGGPKASFSDVQYLNDVIYADWNKEDAYAVGGVRVQSFSDYVPRMVFDYMQMVADLTAKQMPVHAYTKEAAFAKTFGLTGIKINMSLVPTVVEGGIAVGLDADGNYAWEEGETFDYDTAIEIQNAEGYRENCGTIAVGVSDEHIDKMLDDDNIRMVIPYHKSGLNKAVAIANNIDAFKDYTNQQNTRYADGTKLSSADSKNVPNFNEDTRRLGDPRKAADAYLAWCKESNYKPKFDKWASHPNYYKLLEDFTTLVDGEYFEQRGVTMTFPKEGDAFGSLSNLIAESLEEDAVLEGKRDSLVGTMVDEIESTLFPKREKALETSNSLQKQPNMQDVVSEADVVDDSFSIDRSQSVEEIASLAESEGTTSFSLVRDEAKIAELEASPKRIGYRNVILNEDGSFSSPMATHIGNTGKGKVKSATFNLGEWEEAEENPQLVDEQGKVYIYKDNGGSVKVAYDPYIHNRLDKVNAQFKEAWKRPNLVYVETEVPITDLESGYHADKAKLPVGVHSWSNGDLMLSRYDKPIRIVGWEEVADDWVERFKDTGVHFDIVPPALLPILKERGVEILPPHKGLGADATEAYEASRGEESYSVNRDDKSRQKIGATKGSTSSLDQPFPTRRNPILADYGAKLNKNYESAIDDIIKLLEAGEHIGGDTFLRLLDIALANRDKVSKTGSDYVHLGNGATLRISNHYAIVENFYKKNNTKENYGIVIKGDGKKRYIDDKRVDYLEYAYFPDKMDGVGQKALLDGLKQFVKTGDFEGSLPHPDKIHASGEFKGKVVEQSNSLSREREDIERVARENDTWLKAPNGKDTNLSPEQWVTIRTKAFKKWFGDWENDPENASKVVDENGEPKVVYHQTNGTVYINRETGENWDELDWQERDAWDERDDWEEYWEEQDFYTFSRVNARTTNELDGFFFAPEYDEYHEYGERTIPAFLNIRKPASKEDYMVDATYNNAGQKERIRMQNEGYDGVVYVEDDGRVVEYIAFEPNQIKSATENIGTFDSANDDIRYSLNRNDVTIATPELEAEANEELSKETKLAAELEEAQNTIDRMVRKLNAVTERKEMTFDEVKAFLLDSDTMSGLQEASKGQYKRIIRNVLNVLENTPNKRIKVESLVDRIQRELLSARLNLANSNLKAVAKDFKSIITKKREGRNTRGEAIAKYVDNTTRKMMEQFIKTIEYAHSFTDENNKTTTKWENILLVGRIFTNDAIDEAMATLRESLVEEYDEVKDGLLSLLEVYKTMRDCAADVQDVYTKQVGAERDIQDIKEEIDTLQGLIDIYHSGAKGFGKALREIRGMGYNTISDAEARVKALQGTLKALRGEIHSYKQEEADSINRLVEAVKDMNTAILGVDKEGRVALKEELAKKREAMGEFKKGVFRSVRSPHYDKVSSESAKQADKLPYWQRRNMVRRGNVMFSDVTETFEFGLRRMDRMSIANEWLQDGIYYQFIMHPTDGVIARSDWRYKTEKGLRNAFEEEARKRFAPNVKEGKFKFSDLKERVKEKSGIVITTIESRINGEPVDKAKPTTIDLTVGQLLYIRAMVKQQGGINGYLTLGLKADQIEAIVKETEARYPEFCEFDDWIRGEEGILEQIYKIRNEIYRKIYGRDLDHTEGYFPIERMKGAIRKSEDVGETIDASTISGGIGSNKKRVRNSTPMNIDVDYFEKLDKHISESIQWCAGAELIEKMNALLSSSEFRNILEAQGFSKTAFKNGFKRAIGERLGGEEGKDTTAGKVLNSIGKNAVVSNIAFNLNSALKQLVSISATLSNEVSPKLWMYFAKNALVPSAVKKGVTALVDSFMGDDSPIDDVASLPLFFSCYKWAKENVPTFAKRADNETMGFDIFELEGIEKWDRFANKIKEWGMKPNVLMDLFTCSILTKTYYDYQYDRNIKRGMTEQEAHDDARMRASVLMNQTQQSSEGAFVSKYQSDRLTGAAAFFRAGTVAYQNSQLGFDRNARSAYQNIATMLYDMYGKQGAYDKVVEYQAEQYEKRGIAKDKAMKMAKADYRRSFLTQCNVLLHNMLLNNTLWVMSGVMTMYVAQAASFIALAFLGGSGYEDEATEISFENIHKEVAKQLRNSWWVYTIPMSQSLIGKPIADLVGVASTFTSAKHPATLQPLFDTKSAINKLFTVIEKEDDEEVKLQMGALGLVAFDTATRYGLGLSVKNALRIAGGLYGIAKNGETENFMNVLSSPRYLTKEFAGRPRKDETMEEYTERVSGLYKIIHSFSKGEDVSKLRKQYIDRMDEIMFYNADFDYDKFKEDKKKVKRLAKNVTLVGTFNSKSGMVSIRPKEGRVEEHSQLSPNLQAMMWALANSMVAVNYFDTELDTTNNWDEEGVNNRKTYFKLQNDNIQEFLQTYEQLKNTKQE